MTYPDIKFRREEPGAVARTQWGAYHQGEYLGSVYQPFTGGWSQVGGNKGYSSRYEAAYSLYVETRYKDET